MIATPSAAAAVFSPQFPAGLAGWKPLADPVSGPIALLCVTDALDLVGSERFLQRARDLAGRGTCIVADLTQAEFLDSSGVRALLALASELDAAGKELRLVIQPESRVERTLKLLLLLDHFQVFTSLAEACGGVGASGAEPQ